MTQILLLGLHHQQLIGHFASNLFLVRGVSKHAYFNENEKEMQAQMKPNHLISLSQVVFDHQGWVQQVF